MLRSPGESGTHCVTQAGLWLTSFCPGLQDARIPVMHHRTDTFSEIYVQVLEVMLGKGRTYETKVEHRDTQTHKLFINCADIYTLILQATS